MFDLCEHGKYAGEPCEPCSRKALASLPPVRSEPLFCRCGAALIETSNGPYVCSYIAEVEKRQNAGRTCDAPQETP